MTRLYVNDAMGKAFMGTPAWITMGIALVATVVYTVALLHGLAALD